MDLARNRSRWRSYAACFRNHRLSLFLLTLAGLAQSFSWVPAAAILRGIFDQILPEGPHRGTLRPFWVAVAQLMALQLAGLLLAWWIRITALRLSQDVLATLRTRAVEHFYLLPRAFHTQADVEKLHLTLVHETGIIDIMNNAVTTQMLPGAGGALVLFWILVRIEPVYALVLAVVATSPVPAESHDAAACLPAPGTGSRRVAGVQPRRAVYDSGSRSDAVARGGRV